MALSFLSDPPTKYFAGRSDLYRNQIIFACKSWQQVIEQHASFEPKLKAMGRKAKIAWSFDGAVQRRFKVKVRRTSGGTFRPGDVESEQTVQDIIASNQNLNEKFIRLSLAFLRDGDRFSNFAVPDIVSVEPIDKSGVDEDYLDGLGDDPPAMIFTTFAQLRLLEAKSDNIPLNWIIWIDDPDIDELIDIKPAKETKRPPKKEKPVIDGTRYDVRDEYHSLALPLKDHRCIYTTTERVTVKKLKHFLDSRNEEYLVHGDRYHVTGGKVTILGTQAVQKKYDALIPLIARRINQTTEKNLILIADGIPSEFNHATNKGRNDLSDRNILVEISHPHPVNVKNICDSMGLMFDTHRDEISKELMLDKAHQAIGRNSGFRSNGGECVVLVDKARHQYLVSECSYQIDTVNSVIIDRTEKMTRKDKRIADSASPLVKMIEEIINNPHDYFGQSRKIKSDIKYVVSTISDPVKVEDYLVRLFVALTSYSDIRFDRDSPRDSQSKKVIDLSNWILKEFIEPSRKIPFLERYIREVST